MSVFFLYLITAGVKQFILNLINCEILLSDIEHKQAPTNLWHNRKMCLWGTEANDNKITHFTQGRGRMAEYKLKAKFS